MIRIERRFPAFFSQGELVVSTEIPESANQREAAAAVHALLQAIPDLESLCPGCGTPPKHIHFPECPLAPPDMLAHVYAEHEAGTARRSWSGDE
jgi:hypothetical protein